MYESKWASITKELSKSSAKLEILVSELSNCPCRESLNTIESELTEEYNFYNNLAVNFHYF